MPQDSPLLALAPELRNMIYRSVLISADPIDISCEDAATPPAILATCRQIKEEATSIYYGENTFSATEPPSTLPKAETYVRWLDRSGETNCRQVANFRLTLEPIKDLQELVLPLLDTLPESACSGFGKLARIHVKLLEAMGIRPNAMHFEAPEDMKTFMDRARMVWHKAGERELQERAGNGDGESDGYGAWEESSDEEGEEADDEGSD
ncbi:hypothetical protein LTR36_004412 [Oleoguttula mirabilis]|uniref:Uncharacterized protein n=1 Tax=Oleoguttula mirabilis TaxID=1507867 RepID=A0AAV9JH57_9PEZI|nr:hypothetical protein LTR36_004412 [Oleoguttula mirabilis]